MRVLGKVRDMRVLARTVHVAALAAVLGSGLTACGSGHTGTSAEPAREQHARKQHARIVAIASRGGQPQRLVRRRRHHHLRDARYPRAPVRAAACRGAAAGRQRAHGPGRERHRADLTPYILQLVAGELARMGIMSLRFDKYFSGLTGGGAFAANPSAIDLAAYIRQADAAYDFLRAQPETNTRQMLVVGHSEGGMYALLVAETASPHPAGLALIEPQDERLLSLVQLQADEQSTRPWSRAAYRASGPQNAARVRQAIASSGRPAGGHQGPGARRAAADHARASLPRQRPLRALRRRGVPAVGRGPAGPRHPDPGHRRHRGHQHPGQHDQAPRQRPGRSRGHRPQPARAHGVNHLLHMPGVSANSQALAPSAVAALQDWARPFALP